MTEIIRFSHRYFKMPPDVENKTTFLLEIFRVVASNLSPMFLLYDTSYPGGQYKLNNGEMIVLLLKTDNYLWTTIRSYNPGKWRYYEKMRGNPVEIIIEE